VNGDSQSQYYRESRHRFCCSNQKEGKKKHLSKEFKMSGITTTTTSKTRSPVSNGHTLSLKLRGRMDMRCSSGEALNWKNLWMLIVTDNQLTSTLLFFLFDGRHLRVEQTLGELEMEDGDEIGVMLHQIEGFVLWRMSSSRFIFYEIISRISLHKVRLLQMDDSLWMNTVRRSCVNFRLGSSFEECSG